ncbi:HAD family phosphatase [Synechococcus sp. CBW1004]|jgi:pseudouridine-5'-monophosphatase|uniref:HAD family hydrolase n=1 Tax=Synechococcus sp. CBW1004 TaxID=1353136 RepID=UPI0018CDFF79|nr:HAD family phosphatase [Synechococcus sp. CBW1004]QPN63220.1 HAD family phosphatase [Synechococcus sp. CBW1004]
MSAPAACLFDLDGLLLDTEPLHSLAWRQAAERFGLQLPDAELMRLRGRRRLDNARQVITWIAERVGAPPTVEELLAVQQPIARGLLPRAEPMEGAPELLRQCLERQVAMALVTSSSRESLALKTAGHPWLELIELRIDGDDPDLKAGKPAPDPFLLAAERLGVSPGDCWAFEDSPAGAIAAAAAGCRVHVLVPPGLSPEERQRLYPGDWIFLESLRDLAFERRA